MKNEIVQINFCASIVMEALWSKWQVNMGFGIWVRSVHFYYVQPEYWRALSETSVHAHKQLTIIK